MKYIKIMRLSLENFKCHDQLVIEPMGRNISIYGDNATGKSSIYDGLCWLLFGKDSHGSGEKNIDLKPLDAMGNVRDHAAITAVEATLDVDGETVSLRRELREIWTTKRGADEATYDGNESSYYCCGVPMKKTEYERRVGEIVPEDIFRLLTSVTYFASDLRWQDRRKALFDLAGISDDAQIIASEPKFAPLAEAMGSLSLDDLRKRLAAEKRGLNGTRDGHPERIAEQKQLLASIGSRDYAAAEAAKKEAEQELDELVAHMDSMSQQQVAAEMERIRETDRRISRAETELRALEGRKREHRLSQQAAAGADAQTVEAAKAHLASLYKSRDRAKLDFQRAQRDESNAECAIETYRKEWAKINAEQFSGGICPTCGQALPQEKLTEAVRQFEAGKKSHMERCVASAEQYKAVLASATERKNAAQTAVQEAEKEISGIVLPEEKAMAIEEPGYETEKAALTQELEAAKAAQRPMEPYRDEETEAKIAELKAGIQRATEYLAGREIVRQIEVRIEQLTAELNAAAEQLEKIEKLEHLADLYVRHKTAYIETSINGMFLLAKFRLFREQANGGVEERCDVTYGGIPYASLNNAARINVGIDIIRTMSQHYGFSVPLVVDNAESVTALEELAGQMIRLVVSEGDKTLRIV